MTDPTGNALRAAQEADMTKEDEMLAAISDAIRAKSYERGFPVHANVCMHLAAAALATIRMDAMARPSPSGLIDRWTLVKAIRTANMVSASYTRGDAADAAADAILALLSTAGAGEPGAYRDQATDNALAREEEANRLFEEHEIAAGRRTRRALDPATRQPEQPVATPLVSVLDDELLIEWRDASNYIVISVQDGGVGYSVRRNGVFEPGKHKAWSAEAATEIRSEIEKIPHPTGHPLDPATIGACADVVIGWKARSYDEEQLLANIEAAIRALAAPETKTE